MSGSSSYVKSMNGIVSLSDGQGTTIEDDELITDTIDCNTLTAHSKITALFTPTTNYDVCNKLYVDNVANSGSNILPLDNVFTGTSNTFNSSLITNNIVQKSSGSSNINLYNTLSSNSIINMFSDTTNTYNGLINICSGVGVQNPSMNIFVGDDTVFYGIKPLKIGDKNTSITLCNSIKITQDVISAIDNTTSKDIYKFNTGNIQLGGTGLIKLGNTITIDENRIESTTDSDIIGLFKDLNTGNIQTCKNLRLSPSNYNCENEDNIIRITEKLTTGDLRICNNLTTGNVYIADNVLTTGSVSMCSTFIFKVNELLSSAVDSVINLFTNITTGALNIATGMTTGNIYIGSAMTSGTIFIGNTTGITNNNQGNIEMGNGDNSSNTVDDGRVTINKLRIGQDGSSYRCCIIGRNQGAGLGGIRTFTIPGAPTTLGTCIVFANINVSTTNMYIIMVNPLNATQFSYCKRGWNGGGFFDATSESFNYVAYWI